MCVVVIEEGVNDEQVNPEVPYKKVAIGKMAPGFLRGGRGENKTQEYGTQEGTAGLHCESSLGNT